MAWRDQEMPRNFDRATYSRNRVVGWDPTAKNGQGEPVTSDDCLNEDGSLNQEAIAKYKVDPEEVYRITPARMGEPYATGDGMAMLAALAATRKDKDGNPEDPEDTLVQLVLTAHGNDLYNTTLAACRPVKVTEKSINKAFAVLQQVTGLSDEEIRKMLAAAKTD